MLRRSSTSIVVSLLLAFLVPSLVMAQDIEETPLELPQAPASVDLGPTPVEEAIDLFTLQLPDGETVSPYVGSQSNSQDYVNPPTIVFGITVEY